MEIRSRKRPRVTLTQTKEREKGVQTLTLLAVLKWGRKCCQIMSGSQTKDDDPVLTFFLVFDRYILYNSPFSDSVSSTFRRSFDRPTEKWKTIRTTWIFLNQITSSLLLTIPRFELHCSIQVHVHIMLSSE